MLLHQILKIFRCYKTTSETFSCIYISLGEFSDLFLSIADLNSSFMFSKFKQFINYLRSFWTETFGNVVKYWLHSLYSLRIFIISFSLTLMEKSKGCDKLILNWLFSSPKGLAVFGENRRDRLYLITTFELYGRLDTAQATFQKKHCKTWHMYFIYCIWKCNWDTQSPG